MIWCDFVSIVKTNAKTLLKTFFCSCSTSRVSCLLQKYSRVRIVDNSELGKQCIEVGKPAKIIHVYNKTGKGTTGDRVMLAVRGQKVRGYIVGVRCKRLPLMQPSFDSNNVVLMNEDGTPMGTRIRVPLPSFLRGKTGEFSKLIAIGSRFV